MITTLSAIKQTKFYIFSTIICRLVFICACYLFFSWAAMLVAVANSQQAYASNMVQYYTAYALVPSPEDERIDNVSKWHFCGPVNWAITYMIFISDCSKQLWAQIQALLGHTLLLTLPDSNNQLRLLCDVTYCNVTSVMLSSCPDPLHCYISLWAMLFTAMTKATWLSVVQVLLEFIPYSFK